MKTKLFLIATSLLFLVAMLFAWRVWAAPRQVEREVTLLNYELKSSWGQQAYGTEQKKEEQQNPTFFNRLIGGIEVSYSYKFVPARPVKTVATEVEIATVLESPGAWKKEITLVERSKQGDKFTLSFPLDISAIQKAGAQIGAELGTGYSSSNTTLKALVHVRAETETGTIVEDDFVQTVGVRPKGALLEWDRGLGLFQAGYQKGLKWEHQGSFGYAISLKPSPLDSPQATLDSLLSTEEKPVKPSEPEPKPVFFTKLIDSMSLSYNYQLSTSTTGIETSGWGEVWMVVENPGVWRKKVILVPRTEYKGQYSAKFPLAPAELSKLVADMAADIDKEIGTKTTTPKVSLEAAVHTKLKRGTQESAVDFVQPLELKIGETALEMGGLSLTSHGEWGRVDFEQWGGFGYRVQLKPNSLGLGPIIESKPTPPTIKEQPSASQVVKSEIPQKALPTKLAAAQSYDSKGLERIDMTLTYEMAGDKAPDKIKQQAEIKALLKGVGWAEGFTLATASYDKTKFDFTFPLDTAFFYLVIADQEKRTGTSSSTYDLVISSRVTTTGETQGHPIEDSSEQTLTVKLGKAKVELPELTPQSKSGAATGNVVVTRSLTGTDRMGSLGVVGVSRVLLLYSASDYWEQRRRRLPPWRIEALRAKKKYREILVDVQTLPDEAGQTAVQLSSLEELVKVAEALLKPVLMHQEENGYVYRVIDGPTHYDYVNKAVSLPKRPIEAK